jgi:hypothetical protein
MVAGRFAARFHLCLRHGAGRQFAWLGVGSGKMALSRPTHQWVTQAVGRQKDFVLY